MNADIRARIELNMPTLSRSEGKVARWIIAEPQRAADASLAEVAEAAGVSEPTVIRFCRSMGLSGFRELRTHLLLSVRHPESFLHQDVNPSDGLGEAVGKVLDTSVLSLVNLRAIAGTMPFEQAVCHMQRARQLIFVGLGASGWVARDAAHKFFRLGIPCSCATDIQTIAQSAAIAVTGDVYLAISHSGRWVDLVDAMLMAKANGGFVVAVTDPSSTLAAGADLVFESHPTEDLNLYTPMSSRLVQLALLDALQVVLALSMGESAELKLRQSKLALSAYRSGETPGSLQA